MMKCDVAGRNFAVDEKMHTYIEDKIGGLDKYLPRQVRDSVRCNVILEDDPSGREDNRYVCEVVLTLPGAKLVSREGTVNVYAAVDIVEAKLRSQLATYKNKHALEPRRGRRLAGWLGRRHEPEPETEMPIDASKE
jgi:putative sigma-54 modulation protein